MEIKITKEAGFEEAMRGLARSYDQFPDPVRMAKIALRLGNKDQGHNKFLESMQVWMDIEAPRYWWQEFDTYRAGVSKQSDSTMHTLMRMPLSQRNFEYAILPSYLEHLNLMIQGGSDLELIKNRLPEGFLQGRTVCLNYKVIRHIILQRGKHRLRGWQFFCHKMRELKHYELLGFKEEEEGTPEPKEISNPFSLEQ